MLTSTLMTLVKILKVSIKKLCDYDIDNSCVIIDKISINRIFKQYIRAFVNESH